MTGVTGATTGATGARTGATASSTNPEGRSARPGRTPGRAVTAIGWPPGEPSCISLVRARGPRSGRLARVHPGPAGLSLLQDLWRSLHQPPASPHRHAQPDEGEMMPENVRTVA